VPKFTEKLNYQLRGIFGQAYVALAPWVKKGFYNYFNMGGLPVSANGKLCACPNQKADARAIFILNQCVFHALI